MTPLAARKELLISPPPGSRQYHTNHGTRPRWTGFGVVYLSSLIQPRDRNTSSRQQVSANGSSSLKEAEKDYSTTKHERLWSLENWRRYLEDKPATDSHQQGGTGFLHGSSSTLFECRRKKQKINRISTNYLQGCLDIRLIVAKRNHDNDYNCDIYIKSEITLCTVTFVSLLEMNDTQSMRVGRWRESVIKSGQKEEMH